MAYVPIQARISDAQKERAEARAEQDGKSLSEVVRDAIDAYTTAPCERCKGSGKEPTA